MLDTFDVNPNDRIQHSHGLISDLVHSLKKH